MLGSNVPTVGGLHKGFEWGDKWKCECIQIYVSLSRRWDVIPLSKNEIKKFKEAWEKSSVKEVIAHVPYLVNLASPEEKIWNKSVKRLSIEISRAQMLGVPLLVLHPGSHGSLTKEKGIQRIVKGLNKILERIDTPVKILLETMAGQGKTIGSCFEELAAILEGVNKEEKMGICLDTGHLHMAGYDIKSSEGYREVFRVFDRLIGIEKIGCIHLNDSKTQLGSKVDRHACIGEGEIGLQTFRRILTDEMFKHIPKILEVPDRDKRSEDNLKLLRSLQY